MSEKKDKKIDKKVSEVEQLKSQNQELQDKYVRALAEVENTKHRAHLDVNRKSQILLENFAKDLLPVLDNFERAMQAAQSDNPDLQNFIVGIQFIYTDLLKAIERHGIEAINKVNEDFDPTKHKAIDFKEGTKNKILEIKQSGYLLNGKVLREALVVVGK